MAKKNQPQEPLTPQPLSKFAISYSALKAFPDMTPAEWYGQYVTKTIPRPRKPKTANGSYLDCRVFTPDEVKDRFQIIDVAKPSDKVTSIVHLLKDHIDGLNKRAEEMNKEQGTKIPMKILSLESEKDFIQKLCIQEDHYASKPEQGYNDVVKKGKAYTDILAQAGKRQLVAQKDDELVKRLEQILYTDPVSKPFFKTGLKKGCEVIYQVAIETEYEVGGDTGIDAFKCKGFLDILHFNHPKKIVREVDLKLSEPFEFPDRIRQFKYVDQHSFYDFLIRQFLRTYKGGIYKDYTVGNPLNLVIGEKEQVPYIYQYNANDLEIARKGIEGTKLRGWEDIIKDIAEHFVLGNWSRPLSHLKNGFIPVQYFNKR